MSVIEYRRAAVNKLHLHGFRCKECGVLLPSWERYTCGECGSTELVREELSGKAKITHLGVVYYPPPEFQGEEPYLLAEIVTEEGLRTSARIIKMPLGDLEVGDTVQSTIRRIKVGDEGELYYGVKYVKV
ncbi:MAG TPA: OB-fold domain-containing protein [Desulfobacteria bacterium]|nr:OB-fold domain-containing protein [Desulfobacteria bacterium]